MHIDILILGDKHSAIALELGSIKRLGEQVTVDTQHRSRSLPGDVGGFDLIILDVCNENDTPEIHQRKTSALGICRRLRRNTDVPILLTSSIDDESFATDAYDVGVDEFIVKPIIPELLNEKLLAWLRWTEPKTASVTDSLGRPSDNRRQPGSGRQLFKERVAGCVPQIENDVE